MFLEEKVQQIECFLRKIEKQKIVVWGAGVHTEQLFKYTTLLLSFPDLEIVDENKSEKMFFGKKVCAADEICWKDVNYVIVSSFKFQKEIISQVKRIAAFKGEVFALYSEEDGSEFYHWNKRDEDTLSWQGNYSTWEEARNGAKGYEDSDILAKVCEATKKVVDMKYGFERDSVIFYYNEYSYLLLMFIAFCAVRQKTVRITDFGGSLGTLYWKNRALFREIENVEIEWSVVEQKHFVDCGRENFRHEKDIQFYYSLSDIREEQDIVLFSGVLQFLEEYWQIVKAAVDMRPRYIVIDRTYFMRHEKICIQSVPESIYKSSYPIRFFDKQKFIALFNGEYSLLVDGTVEGVREDFYADGENCYEGFMVFKRRE